MDPEVGLPHQRGAADDAGIVEDRRLIGHQADARDAAGSAGGTIDREHAEVDDAGGKGEALAVDGTSAFEGAVAMVSPSKAKAIAAAEDCRTLAKAVFMPSPPRRVRLL